MILFQAAIISAMSCAAVVLVMLLSVALSMPEL
jgi:hypothetical protein